MKKIYLLLITLFTSLFAQENPHSFYDIEETDNQEEALYIRRILEFWEEGEMTLAESQIKEFLDQYPDNQYRDKMLAVLGDLAMQEGNYKAAVTRYSDIKDSELHNKVVLNKLQCMRKLGWFTSLSENCEELLSKHKLGTHNTHTVTYFLADSFYNLALRTPQDHEKYTTYAENAKTHFESLKESSFEKKILQPLAHVYSLLNDYEKAAELYVHIGNQSTDIKEDMLFHAATLEVEFDKEKAVQTYGQIYRLGKKKAPDAAYNRMILLFELEKYSEIILAKEELLEYVPKAKKPLVYFFLGRSYYHLGDHKRAIRELSTFIKTDSELQEELHNAYVTILDSAKLLKNIKKYNDFLPQFEKAFSGSQSLAIAYKDRGALHKELENFELAKDDYLYVLENFPDFEYRDIALFEFAHLQYLRKDYANAKTLAQSCIDQYPSSSFLPDCWKLFLHASVNDAAADPELKKTLIQDISTVLKQDVLTEDENNDYTYLLAKTHYELENYSKTIGLLLALTDKPISPNRLSESFLLIANAYRNSSDNHALYCSFAEKAINANAEIENLDEVHLSLFNSYVTLHKSSPSDHHLEKAAEHLFQAKYLGVQIKPKNQLWLINFYYDTVNDYLDQSWTHRFDDEPKFKSAAERSLTLLQDFSTEDLSLQESLNIKLATLYGHIGRHRTELKILTNLNELYNKHPDHPFEKTQETHYHLGKTYLKLGMKKKAVKEFQVISENASSLQSYIPAYAALYTARIQYALLDKNFLTQKNEDLFSILSLFKTIYLQKTLANEPLHLEAAFDYIDILSDVTEKDKNEKKITLIQRTLDHFFSEEDVLSKEYQLQRKYSPNQEKIFLAYIDLLDLELMITKLNLAIERNEIDEAKKLYQSAQILHHELTPITPSFYFENRLNKMEESLKVLSMSLDRKQK